MARLQDEIRRTHPFEVIEEEAMLNILRTAQMLADSAAQLIKPAELTATQYNVLRILRGAGKGGLPANEIGARMITRDPDITRLLQRLEIRGLVVRKRGSKDRRVVLACITSAGLAVLKLLDSPVIEHLRRQLGHLGPKRLGQLISLLEECRRNLS